MSDPLTETAGLLLAARAVLITERAASVHERWDHAVLTLAVNKLDDTIASVGGIRLVRARRLEASPATDQTLTEYVEDGVTKAESPC